MDMVDVADLADDEIAAAIPLTKTNWLALFDNTTIEAKASEALVREGNMFEMLANFHKLAFRLERLNRQLAVVDDANLEPRSCNEPTCRGKRGSQTTLQPL